MLYYSCAPAACLHVCPASAQMKQIPDSDYAGMPAAAAAIARHVRVALLPLQAGEQTQPGALSSG
jgi:hypothetical protein